MSLRQKPELLAFLSTFMEADAEDDQKSAQTFATGADPTRLHAILTQGRALIAANAASPEEFGAEANRWFVDSSEAAEWLSQMLAPIESALVAVPLDGALVVKDSNGAVLAEGDSVTVIKDLKVKGGSSDLSEAP